MRKPTPPHQSHRSTARLSRRRQRISSANVAHLLRLRAMSDAQLNELRTRAVGFLVAFDIARDAKVKARQLLRWVLTEQRLRRAIAALPDAHELMAIHRRSDAELLDEGRRALARFRDAYGRKGELSDSSRMEAARQATWLRREWSTRHSGPDLLEVLERTK